MSRLWRAFTRNLLLKFSALVCAVVVWVYVDSTLFATRVISVPVYLPPKGMPKGLHAVWSDGIFEHEGQAFVKVSVHGRREHVFFARIAAKYLGVPGGLSEGPYRVKVSEDDFHFISDEKPAIIGIEPREVTFDIRKRPADLMQ